jgi:hypothetical protein
MKNSIFLNVTPCGSCKNRYFRGTYRFHHKGDQNQQATVFLRSVLRLLFGVNVPSSPILAALIMEAIRSSEMSVLTKASRRNIPEEGIFSGFSSASELYRPISRRLSANLVPTFWCRWVLRCQRTGCLRSLI